jgi:ankyrin repeat protein
MMSSSSTSSKLINWVFIGNLSNPPNIWKSLQTGEIPDVINNFFEFPENTLFPNGQFLRRGRETNLLQAAAAAGRVDFLNYFRNIPQIDITKKTTSDISVFHLALDGDTVRCLRTVNKNNPNETEQLLETLMQSTSDTGSTPVHYAVGRPSAMKALLELGCNPVVRNNGKSIPLHYAGSREVAELLIKYSSSTFVNTKNSLGDTPLHLAISHGLTEVVMVLLRHGADIELPLNSLSRRNVTMTVNKLLGKLEQQILSQQYLSNVRDRSSGSSGSGGSGGSSGSGGSGGSGETPNSKKEGNSSGSAGRQNSISLMLITTDNAIDVFHKFSESKRRIEEQLSEKGIIDAIRKQERQTQFTTADIGVPQAFHFIYVHGKSSVPQYCSTALSVAPYLDKDSQKRLLRR